MQRHQFLQSSWRLHLYSCREMTSFASSQQGSKGSVHPKHSSPGLVLIWSAEHTGVRVLLLAMPGPPGFYQEIYFLNARQLPHCQERVPTSVESCHFFEGLLSRQALFIPSLTDSINPPPGQVLPRSFILALCRPSLLHSCLYFLFILVPLEWYSRSSLGLALCAFRDRIERTRDFFLYSFENRRAGFNP
jgi:hypothetical protein